MTLRRTVDVPRTEPVEFARCGRIEVRETLSGGAVGFRLASRDLNAPLTTGSRFLVSADPAGDQMRGGPMRFLGNQPRPDAETLAVFMDAAGTETEGDWLWVEVVRPQESLQELMRRQYAPGAGLPAPWGLGDLVGGGRRQ